MPRLVPAVLLLLASSAAGAQTVTLSHSGYLLEANDTPANGPRTLSFALFRQPTGLAEGETPWESGPCVITVRAGYYTVRLGEECGSGLGASDLPGGQVRYLELRVGATALVPRSAVAPMPNATVADNALKLGNVAAADYLLESELTAGSGLSVTGTEIALASDAASLALVSGGKLSVTGSRVGVGTTSAHASAALEIASTTGGLLPPRLSATERDAIASPASGLVVFNTTTNRLNVFDGAWRELAPSLGREKTSPATSCSAVKAAGWATSGVFWLKPTTSAPVMQVWCDMEVDDGSGYALVLNSVGAQYSRAQEFWKIAYADRFSRKGTPSPLANHYNGELYKYGTTYVDFIENRAGQTGVVFKATTSGINQTTMNFQSPVLLAGDANVYSYQFAAGWSSFDADHDPHGSSCGANYAITQHYKDCYYYSVGYDYGGSFPGWGPSMNANLSLAGFSCPNEQSGYCMLKRLARYAKW